MIRYCPDPSVTADRVFSMSAGLAASTLTPGNTAPDASWTVPVRAAWAKTVPGRRRTARIARHFAEVRITNLLRTRTAKERSYERVSSGARRQESNDCMQGGQG